VQKARNDRKPVSRNRLGDLLDGEGALLRRNVCRRPAVVTYLPPAEWTACPAKSDKTCTAAMRLFAKFLWTLVLTFESDVVWIGMSCRVKLV